MRLCGLLFSGVLNTDGTTTDRWGNCHQYFCLGAYWVLLVDVLFVQAVRNYSVWLLCEARTDLWYTCSITYSCYTYSCSPLQVLMHLRGCECALAKLLDRCVQGRERGRERDKSIRGSLGKLNTWGAHQPSRPTCFKVRPIPSTFTFNFQGIGLRCERCRNRISPLGQRVGTLSRKVWVQVFACHLGLLFWRL